MKLHFTMRRNKMKKVVFGSALAVGLLFSGAGQSSANGQIQPNDIQGMDLESALQAVQSQRAQLLENQLKDQLEGVQQRNQQLADLNTQLAGLHQERAAIPVEDQDTHSALDREIQDVKGQIDGLSNSQQMDMLRLQGLSNKRNEAFDTMTNFIKKMQDSRSSIIGNMR